MRKFVIFTNFGFIVFLFILFFRSNNQPSEKDILIFIIFLELPILNLTAFWMASNSRDIFSLFIERKRLEQEKKIADLRKSLDKES